MPVPLVGMLFGLGLIVGSHLPTGLASVIGAIAVFGFWVMTLVKD